MKSINQFSYNWLISKFIISDQSLQQKVVFLQLEMSKRMQKLDELLNIKTQQNKVNYEYLPVSTSYKAELKKQADQLLAKRFLIKKNSASHNEQFQSNQTLENIKNDLILLKLKGYIDPRDIRGKSTQLKKLPSKVQVGTMIDGDPIQAAKFRNKKKTNEFIDYFLNRDDAAEFTNKKFNEIQKLKQRKKRIKKRIIQKKQKHSNSKQKSS